MSLKITDQEKFWAGEFGKEYSKRNNTDTMRAGNTVLFSRIVSRTQGVNSLIEFGANIGLNLEAIRHILPAAELSAVEINAFAAKELKKNVSGVKVYEQSMLEFKLDYSRDFVLIKGVLIHQAPEKLNKAYDTLYKASSKYICLVEYYNPFPVEVSYRGHSGKLFKRDFAGEIMARHKDLRLVDYGFAYHGDTMCPLDDVTWFLMEKR